MKYLHYFRIHLRNFCYSDSSVTRAQVIIDAFKYLSKTRRIASSWAPPQSKEQNSRLNFTIPIKLCLIEPTVKVYLDTANCPVCDDTFDTHLDTHFFEVEDSFYILYRFNKHLTYTNESNLVIEILLSFVLPGQFEIHFLLQLENIKELRK